MKNSIVKALYIVLGILCIILGIIGAILPIVPSVPFFVATLYFFLHGSSRLYRWYTKTYVYTHVIQRFFSKEGTPIHMVFLMLTYSVGLLLFSIYFVNKTVVSITGNIFAFLYIIYVVFFVKIKPKSPRVDKKE